jgi:hypothetical protein
LPERLVQAMVSTLSQPVDLDHEIEGDVALPPVGHARLPARPGRAPTVDHVLGQSNRARDQLSRIGAISAFLRASRGAIKDPTDGFHRST